MTLSEFIKKLQAIEAAGSGDVPVVVADWPEGYEFPSEEAAEKITLGTGPYWPWPEDNKTTKPSVGDTVCIGC